MIGQFFTCTSPRNKYNEKKNHDPEDFVAELSSVRNEESSTSSSDRSPASTPPTTPRKLTPKKSKRKKPKNRRKEKEPVDEHAITVMQTPATPATTVTDSTSPEALASPSVVIDEEHKDVTPFSPQSPRGDIPRSTSTNSMGTPPLVLHRKKKPDSKCDQITQYVSDLSLRFARPIQVLGTGFETLNTYFSSTNFLVLVSSLSEKTKLSLENPGVITVGFIGGLFSGVLSWFRIGEGLHYVEINKRTTDGLVDAVNRLSANQDLLSTAYEDIKKENHQLKKQVAAQVASDKKKDERIYELEQQVHRLKFPSEPMSEHPSDRKFFKSPKPSPFTFIRRLSSGGSAPTSPKTSRKMPSKLERSNAAHNLLTPSTLKPTSSGISASRSESELRSTSLLSFRKNRE